MDVETGGLDPRNSSLLSFHGILVDPNSLKIEKTLAIPHIKPDDGIYLIEPGALAINKIDLIEHDKKAVSYTEAQSILFNFFPIKRYNIVPTGYNVDFDISFIKEHLMEIPEEYSEIFTYYSMDVKSIVQFLQMSETIPRHFSSCKLTDIADHFGYDTSNAHNAKVDCELTLSLLRQLTNKE